MKVTPAILAKMIKEANEELSHVLKKWGQCETYTIAVGTDPVIPEYDFTAASNEVRSLSNKIAALKHIRNTFNCTHVLNKCCITIDAALVEMTLLTAMKAKYDQMRARLAKTSKSSYNSTTPEYTCINYNLEWAEQQYKVTSERLKEIQLELDFCNATAEIDMPDELI